MKLRLVSPLAKSGDISLAALAVACVLNVAVFVIAGVVITAFFIRIKSQRLEGKKNYGEKYNVHWPRSVTTTSESSKFSNRWLVYLLHFRDTLQMSRLMHVRYQCHQVTDR